MPAGVFGGELPFEEFVEEDFFGANHSGADAAGSLEAAKPELKSAESFDHLGVAVFPAPSVEGLADAAGDSGH